MGRLFSVIENIQLGACLGAIGARLGVLRLGVSPVERAPIYPMLLFGAQKYAITWPFWKPLISWGHSFGSHTTPSQTPGADPRRSTLGFCNLHNRSIRMGASNCWIEVWDTDCFLCVKEKPATATRELRAALGAAGRGFTADVAASINFFVCQNGRNYGSSVYSKRCRINIINTMSTRPHRHTGLTPCPVNVSCSHHCQLSAILCSALRRVSHSESESIGAIENQSQEPQLKFVHQKA